MNEQLVTAEALIGADPAEVMRELLERAKLPLLFEAQELGLREPAGATAGTLLYVAGWMREIPDTVLRPYFEELASLIGPSGSIDYPPEYHLAVEANWADAWCLSALLRRPHLVPGDAIRRLAMSLLAREDASGGWGLRPDRPGRPHPLFCLPVALALRQLQETSICPPPLLGAARANLASYLRRAGETPLSVRLLQRAALDILGVRPRPDDLEALHAETWVDGEVRFDPAYVVREDQPLWHAKIDRTLMVLIARRLWPILDPVNVCLSGELLDSFDAGRGGWPNGPDDRAICTWRTAESLMAVDLIARDLRNSGADLQTWQARREDSRRLRQTDGFDVGISFSSRQRDIAVRIRQVLRGAGLTVFYDEDYQHEFLGADMNVYLHDAYFRRCRYAVAILSQDFVASNWSGSTEWRAILTRLQAARGNFLLPYYVDNVEVPGLSPSIGFIRMETHDPEQFAAIVVRKIMGSR
jgi:TIR domain